MHPDGAITPCCYLHDYEIGNANEKKSVYDAFQSPQLIKLREEHLSGCSSVCAGNIETKNCNQRNDSYFDEKFFKNPELKRLDLRLNGKCNIECIMCYEWKKPNNLYDQTDFWEKGEAEIFPFIEDVYLGGGEPLIQPSVYRVIEKIFEKNPACSFSINTNGQYNLNQTQLKLLKKIKIENLYLSIDSLDPVVFETIRKKGSLEKIFQNLHFFKKLKLIKNFNFFIAFVLQRDNVMELEAFCKFCRDNGAYLVVHYLEEPSELSVNRFDNESKIKLLNRTLELLAEYPDFSSGLNHILSGLKLKS